jgi:hypothetical protein
MNPWVIAAAVAVALLAGAVPSSAQTPGRSMEAGAQARDTTTGQSAARSASRQPRRAASRTAETAHPPGPPRDLPPGYHKVDHQTGLPNPSIPSR